MFYTGTDRTGDDSHMRQRIGLAVSRDLISWQRYPANLCAGASGPGCVYQCDECWTSWGDTTVSYAHQCRDPFIIRDRGKSRWVMLTTARHREGWGVVTVAYSENLIEWSGAGFIEATGRVEGGPMGQGTGGEAENPHLAVHGGTYYLFFTDWRDQEDSVSVNNPRTITQYATSATLLADTTGSPNWTYRGYIPDPGVNAIEILNIPVSMELMPRDVANAGYGTLSVMSQSISNERSGYWERRRQLKLKCIHWEGELSLKTSNLYLSRRSTGGRSIYW